MTVQVLEGFGGLALCAASIVAAILLAYTVVGLVISKQPPLGPNDKGGG